VGVTPIYGFPYPSISDSPNGPAQLQALAEAVEADLSNTDSNVGALTAASQSLSNTSYIEYARSTDQTIPNVTAEKILFDVVTKSSTDMTAATVGSGTEFTCAKAGRWLWITNGSLNGSSAGIVRAWWLENPSGGTRHAVQATTVSAFFAAFSVSREVTMTVGSTMSVVTYQDTGGSLSTLVSQAPINVSARWLGLS
jgi:hypothetical protein